MAKSIYKMKKYGVSILPPSINKSDVSFTPIEEDNTILYGLGGIAGINVDIAKEIIANRPYTSFKQFYDTFTAKDKNETLVKPSKIIALIKAGCFDEFNTNRVALMKWFFVYQNPPKPALTTANIPRLMELEVPMPEDIIRPYKFKQYVLSKQFYYCQDPNFKSKKHYIVEPTYAKPYFEEHYMSQLEEDKDYYYAGSDLIVVDKGLEKAMKNDLISLKEYLDDKLVIDEYNRRNLLSIYRETLLLEDINAWAMAAVCFYPNNDHELKHINYEMYNLSHWDELPTEPLFEEKCRGVRVWKQYKLARICGTIIDRNDKDHLVDILTPDNEVVTLNIPQGQFGYYKKVISDIIDDKKVVYDDNWLQRGEKIMVSGFRRDNAFYVKRYSSSIFQHSIVRIKSIAEDGTCDVQLEKINIIE